MWISRARYEDKLRMERALSQQTNHEQDCLQDRQRTYDAINRLETAIAALTQKFSSQSESQIAQHRANSKYLLGILVTLVGAVAGLIVTKVMHITGI